MVEDKNTQAAPVTEPEVTTTPVPEPETAKTLESVIIILDTEPEVNDVDQELIFHAPDEEGEDNE